MAIVASNSGRSWAECTDEVLDIDDQLDVIEDQKADLSVVHTTSDEPSVGSAQHRSGRCKPCAFFHTKGCQNGKACLFCHLCPPGEKARRKRLRERMCEKLGQCMQKGGSFDPVDRPFKSGHLRQASGASTSTNSTQSTCSGWTNFSHSRQSSGSSVALSSQDAGVVGVQMSSNAHMQQMMPVFHFAHPMVQPTQQPLPRNWNDSQKQGYQSDEVESAAQATSMPIALAQAVPFPEQANSSGWNTPEMTPQMPPTSMAPWNGQGMVQYAVVAVPVGMNMQMQQQQHNGDAPAGYACFPQQLQSQMPVTPVHMFGANHESAGGPRT